MEFNVHTAAHIAASKTASTVHTGVALSLYPRTYLLGWQWVHSKSFALLAGRVACWGSCSIRRRALWGAKWLSQKCAGRGGRHCYALQCAGVAQWVGRAVWRPWRVVVWPMCCSNVDDGVQVVSGILTRTSMHGCAATLQLGCTAPGFSDVIRRVLIPHSRMYIFVLLLTAIVLQHLTVAILLTLPSPFVLLVW
jgi:hypothetical protein